MGWLIAALVAVVVTVLVFGDGVSGAAIPVIVVDDTVVRWVSELDLPGIHGIARGISYAASWWVLQIAGWLLVVALIIFRRWRLLVIELVATQVAVFVNGVVYDVTTQPRPFGVALRGSWGGWSMPSIQMLALTGCSVIALYTLVPDGPSAQSTEVGGCGARRTRRVGPAPSRASIRRATSASPS